MFTYIYNYINNIYIIYYIYKVSFIVFQLISSHKRLMPD